MLLIIFIMLGTVTYGIDQHQIYMYIGSGYSQQVLDTKDQIFDTPSISTGVSYRWNKFLSNESINFFSIALTLGGGIIFPHLRGTQHIINYNSFLQLEIFTGYGVGLGKNKQHQMSILGFSLLPTFYGLLERNNFTQIGGTEIQWYKGFYIPISVGIYLPGYRYVYNRFFIGFQHNVNIIIFGNQNINAPKDNLILSSIGYQIKLEMGFNYDSFSSVNRKKQLEDTKIFVETNRNSILISLFAKIYEEKTKFVTIEMFALTSINDAPKPSNLIAYASKIPVYNNQSQFTKYWKENKNFFNEKMNDQKLIVHTLIKELDTEENILKEYNINKELTEKKNENF